MTRPVEYSEISPWLWGVALFLALVLVAIVAGCSATTEQHETAMPTVEAGPWHIAGQLELSNGVVVDIGAAKVLTSEEGLTVRRLDLDVSGGVLVDGAPQTAAFEYRGARGAEWLQCLLMTADVAQWQAQVRFPLSPACGKAGLVELRYAPFRPEPEPPTVEPI